MFLLPLLAASWRPIAVVLLIAAVFAYRGLLIHERDSARRAVAVCKAQVAELQTSNQELQDAVAHQNRAIENLRDLAQQAQARLAAAEHAADEMAQQAEDESNNLEHAAVPGGCEGAIKWLNNEGQRLGLWQTSAPRS